VIGEHGLEIAMRCQRTANVGDRAAPDGDRAVGPHGVDDRGDVELLVECACIACSAQRGECVGANADVADQGQHAFHRIAHDGIAGLREPAAQHISGEHDLDRAPGAGTRLADRSFERVRNAAFRRWRECGRCKRRKRRHRFTPGHRAIVRDDSRVVLSATFLATSPSP
jgi:hypothetical protein